MDGDTMQAITYDRYGGPEVLVTRTLARPQPSSSELRIRVQAVEATKTDTEMRSLNYSATWLRKPMRLVLGVRRPRRTILGIYFAGTVEEVGAEVTGFSPGDAVYGSTGLRAGAYGEYVVLPAKTVLVAKPKSMTFAESAALALGGINGAHFVELLEVGRGDRVLVNGAGGVIGAHAVQVAAERGATVTGVDAAHKADFVKEMGAATFIDYQAVDITATEQRFDAIVDMVPSTSLTAMHRLLAKGGRYAHGNPTLNLMLAAPFTRRRFGTRTRVRFAEETRSALRDLAAMADAGALRPIVDRVLPMDQAAEAHRLVDTEERVGAIVLAIGEHANER